MLYLVYRIILPATVNLMYELDQGDDSNKSGLSAIIAITYFRVC